MKIVAFFVHIRMFSRFNGMPLCCRARSKMFTMPTKYRRISFASENEDFHFVRHVQCSRHSPHNRLDVCVCVCLGTIDDAVVSFELPDKPKQIPVTLRFHGICTFSLLSLPFWLYGSSYAQSFQRKQRSFPRCADSEIPRIIHEINKWRPEARLEWLQSAQSDK